MSIWSPCEPKDDMQTSEVLQKFVPTEYIFTVDLHVYMTMISLIRFVVLLDTHLCSLKNHEYLLCTSGNTNNTHDTPGWYHIDVLNQLELAQFPHSLSQNYLTLPAHFTQDHPELFYALGLFIP